MENTETLTHNFSFEYAMTEVRLLEMWRKERGNQFYAKELGRAFLIHIIADENDPQVNELSTMVLKLLAPNIEEIRNSSLLAPFFIEGMQEALALRLPKEEPTQQ